MDKENYKEAMYLNYQGFTNIMWNLETEIVLLWTSGQIEAAYERIKQLFMNVESHLKDKKAHEFFDPKFKDIEIKLYDPRNQKFTTHSKYAKERNRRESDALMTEIYRVLKRHMKESGLEVFYGVPGQVITDMKRNSNINKVFGRNKA